MLSNYQSLKTFADTYEKEYIKNIYRLNDLELERFKKSVLSGIKCLGLGDQRGQGQLLKIPWYLNTKH